MQWISKGEILRRFNYCSEAYPFLLLYLIFQLLRKKRIKVLLCQQYSLISATQKKKYKYVNMLRSTKLISQISLNLHGYIYQASSEFSRCWMQIVRISKMFQQAQECNTYAVNASLVFGSLRIGINENYAHGYALVTRFSFVLHTICSLLQRQLTSPSLPFKCFLLCFSTTFLYPFHNGEIIYAL